MVRQRKSKRGNIIVMDIKTLKHIHFTGIKGVGMTSLALCVKNLGIKVTGSDVEEIFVTDETLKKNNIAWTVGFSEKNLNPKPDLIITTGAHGGFDNPEVLAAKALGIPIMSHAEALAEIAKGKEIIAVCGVGGKTSTCSILSTILDYAGLEPSFAVGVADISSLGTPGRLGNGKDFIVEADEFAISPGINNNPRFSLLLPKTIIVTNIQHDHPDIYPTIDDTLKVFKEFFEKLPNNGLLIVNTDDENIVRLLQSVKVPVQTYGTKNNPDWKIENIRYGEQKTLYSIKSPGEKTFDVLLCVPGKFNALNATAAFIAALNLDIKPENILEGLQKYTGCKRRFEKIAEENDILIYDDYAHHPLEIESTLKAARGWFPKRRIVVVFQPHTYSRTKSLFSDFAKSFKDADLVILMDIYASARETDNLGMSTPKLVEETSKFHPNVLYGGNHEQTLKLLETHLKRGDIVLTLGAGDIFHIHNKLKEIIQNK